MRAHRTTLAVTAAGILLVALFAAVLLTSSPQDNPPPSVLRADPNLTYDPVEANEQLPAGFRQLLRRDQIAPIYDPEFVAPDAVDWPGEMLAIGIALDDAAKAYPITPLNQREMVIDSLNGIPLLVTW
ncbi:MAG: DUF3179 domain-containing protein [bacterium]|nr:DUF3179 domain-containing protein [bacterium]